MPNYLFLIAVNALDQDHAEARIRAYIPDPEGNGINILDCQEALKFPYAGKHQKNELLRVVVAEEAVTE